MPTVAVITAYDIAWVLAFISIAGWTPPCTAFEGYYARGLFLRHFALADQPMSSETSPPRSKPNAMHQLPRQGTNLEACTCLDDIIASVLNLDARAF